MNVTQTSDNQQEEEGITQMKKVPFNEVLKMIERGEITDSHTISAITMVGLKLNLIPH